MEINKLVVKFKDGTLLKGKASDFFPNKRAFHLELESGEMVNIEMEELKALFFVKDFKGNANHQDNYNDAVPGGGRKVQVLFNDGETIVGYSQGYSAERTGFYLVPADIQNNNERIYIVNSAVSKATFPKP